MEVHFLKGLKGEDPILRNSICQIAFFGRSNVGKSSVINSLAEKKVAHSSNTPGRTLEINVYETDEKFVLLDFPGYGYAKIPEPLREKLRKMILWYVGEFKPNKRLFILVIDARIGLTEYDKEMLDIFQNERHQYIVVANKIDKMNQSEIAQLKKTLDKHIASKSYMLYSAIEKGSGKKLLQVIESCI